MLKKETSINKENIICLVFEFITEDKLLIGKNPPEEIIDIDKLNETNDLKWEILNTKNIQKVNIIYKIKIFDDCFKISEVLNDKKFVKDFFKLLSKISIKRIIENKK